MFAALKDLTTSSTVKKKPSLLRGVSLKAYRSALRHSNIKSKITTSLLSSNNVVSEFKDLRRLRNIASVHGLNKALMLFANPSNNVISRIVKNIPSNESLDAVSLGKSDRRTKAAIEGMSETIDDEPKLISDWTHASADDVQELLSSIEDQLKDLGEAISHFLETLQTTDTTDEDLSSVVETISYSAALARVEALLEILPDMDALVSNPTDRDAMDIYKEKIAAMIEKIGNIAGIGIDPDNSYLVIAAPTTDDYIVTSSTLSEFGYTAENTVELLKKCDQLVDEVSGLVERKEQMVAHLHETAGMITEIDNSVPPAIDGAISDDESDVTADGLTQADTYHSQVSSHLYCLVTIISVSINAVQDVLDVADALSDDVTDVDIVEIIE